MKKSIGFEQRVKEAKEEMNKWPTWLQEATQLEGQQSHGEYDISEPEKADSKEQQKVA